MVAEQNLKLYYDLDFISNLFWNPKFKEIWKYIDGKLLCSQTHVQCRFSNQYYPPFMISSVTQKRETKSLSLWLNARERIVSNECNWQRGTPNYAQATLPVPANGNCASAADDWWRYWWTGEHSWSEQPSEGEGEIPVLQPITQFWSIVWGSNNNNKIFLCSCWRTSNRCASFSVKTQANIAQLTLEILFRETRTKTGFAAILGVGRGLSISISGVGGVCNATRTSVANQLNCGFVKNWSPIRLNLHMVTAATVA